MQNNPSHKFHVNQLVSVSSGAIYRVQALRSDNHPKLKGELGYFIVKQSAGRDYGPSRLTRESKLKAVE